MKPESQQRAIVVACGKQPYVGLMKRGLWYRPNSGGYTAEESSAGRYTREEAKLHEYIHGEPDDVRIVEFSTPDYINDLRASIQLTNFLAKEGWRCECNNGLDETWECIFYRERRPDTHSDYHGIRDGVETEEHYSGNYTLSAAICEAFLRVKQGSL